MDSTKHNTASEDSPAHGEDSHEPVEWKATRLIDERTGNSCIGVDFPRRQHGRGFESFDDDLAEQPKRVRSLLKTRGAAFTGTKKEQIQFIWQLFKGMPPEPMTLAMKPGFRRPGGFVLGDRMLGTAKGRFRSRSQPGVSDQGEIGNRRGSRADWDRDVGKVALKSSSLTFGLCLALACPLPSYVLANSRQRLLSETAVFNLSGESGSGKTSVVRAAAGVFGPPDLLRKWDFSRRGLEEYAESRNDLLATLDDVETHTDEAGSLRTAMRHVNQIITSGQSKLISTHAELPLLRWTAFGLTSSPEPLDKIAEDIGWKLTNGQRARFPNISVPKVRQAGIFDQLDGDALENVKKGKALITQLDAGVTQNHGLIMPRWLHFLFAEDRSSLILKLRDKFVERVAKNGDGFDERYAIKFAIPGIAGFLAAKYDIVPWPKMWPITAAEICYQSALASAHKDADIARKKMQLIASLMTNTNRFVPAMAGVGEAIRYDDKMLGFRTSYLDRKVLAFRDESFEAFAGSRKIRDLLIDQLRRKKVLLGGHGHAGTTQLPLPITVGGKEIRKPRFWIIDPERLRWAALHPGVEN